MPSASPNCHPAEPATRAFQDLTNRYNVDSYMSKKGLPKLRQFRCAAPLRSCQSAIARALP